MSFEVDVSPVYRYGFRGCSVKKAAEAPGSLRLVLAEQIDGPLLIAGQQVEIG